MAGKKMKTLFERIVTNDSISQDEMRRILDMDFMGNDPIYKVEERVVKDMSHGDTQHVEMFAIYAIGGILYGVKYDKYNGKVGFIEPPSCIVLHADGHYAHLIGPCSRCFKLTGLL